MGFLIQQDLAALEAACRFQTNAELADIQLLDCSAMRTPDSERVDSKLRLSLNMEFEVLGSDRDEIRFGVRLAVHGDDEGGHSDGEQHAFSLSSQYSLRYRLRPGYSPSGQDIDAFKEANAVFNAWPFFREMVQNLTLRMGLQIPPLPLLRLGPKPEPERETARNPRSRRIPTPEPTGDETPV